MLDAIETTSRNLNLHDIDFNHHGAILISVVMKKLPEAFRLEFLRKIASQPTRASLRRLQDVLKRSPHLKTKQDIVETPGKRCLIYVVLKTFNL